MEHTGGTWIAGRSASGWGGDIWTYSETLNIATVYHYTFYFDDVDYEIMHGFPELLLVGRFWQFNDDLDLEAWYAEDRLSLQELNRLRTGDQFHYRRAEP